jgi:hypothetical protein
MSCSIRRRRGWIRGGGTKLLKSHLLRLDDPVKVLVETEAEVEI